MSRLAGEWWVLALNHARSNADDALATERAALETEIRAFDRDQEVFLAEAAALREQMSSANHEAQLAAAQTAELQRLARRLEEQIEEVGHQRDVALTQAVAQRARADALEGQLGSFRDLPAALEAAIRSSASGPDTRKSRSNNKVAASAKGDPRKPTSRPKPRHQRTEVAE